MTEILRMINRIVYNIKNKYIKKDKFVVLTQAEYDALETKDTETFYFIKEE